MLMNVTVTSRILTVFFPSGSTYSQKYIPKLPNLYSVSTISKFCVISWEIQGCVKSNHCPQRAQNLLWGRRPRCQGQVVLVPSATGTESKHRVVSGGFWILPHPSESSSKLWWTAGTKIEIKWCRENLGNCVYISNCRISVMMRQMKLEK